MRLQVVAVAAEQAAAPADELVVDDLLPLGLRHDGEVAAQLADARPLLLGPAVLPIEALLDADDPPFCCMILFIVQQNLFCCPILKNLELTLLFLLFF